MVRLDRDPSPKNVEGFHRWRSSDQRHYEEALKAGAVVTDSERLHGPSLDLLIRAEQQSRERSMRLAFAASICAFLVVPAAVYWALTSSSLRPAAVVAIMLRSNVGEIRKVPLSDGSTVILDTATAVRIELATDRRRAVLEKGRARFSIAKAAVPFELSAGTQTVHIDQGVVDLSRLAGSPSVRLISENSQNSAKGSASEKATVASQTVVSESETPPRIGGVADQSRVDWTTARMSFTGARLEDVIAYANRYTIQQIIVRDPGLKGLRVTGVIRTGDASRLARSLATAFDLVVTKDASGNLNIHRNIQNRPS